MTKSLKNEDENSDILKQIWLCHSSLKKKQPLDGFPVHGEQESLHPRPYTRPYKHIRDSYNALQDLTQASSPTSGASLLLGSLALDFFPVPRWDLVVCNRDSQTSICIQTICNSSKFPGDDDDALWTTLLNSKDLKNVLALLLAIFYLSFRFQFKLSFPQTSPNSQELLHVL